MPTRTTLSPACTQAVQIAGVGVGRADNPQAVAADLVSLDRLAKQEPNPTISASITTVERLLGRVAGTVANQDIPGTRAAAQQFTAEAQRLAALCRG